MGKATIDDVEEIHGPATAHILDVDEVLPSTGLLKQGGRVALPSGKDIASDALSAIPYVATGAAGLATGGMGFIPAVAAGAAAGAGGSAVEQGLRKAADIDPSDNPLGEIGSQAAQGAGAEFGGRALNKLLGMTIGKYLDSKKLYQSALKPTGATETAASKVVNSGIKFGVVPSEEGFHQAVAIQRNADAAVSRMIAANPSDIPPTDYVKQIESGFDRMRAAWGADPVKGKPFIDQIEEHERRFLIDHANVQPIHKQVLNPKLGNTPQNQLQTITINPEDMSLQELRANARPLATGDAQEIKKQAWETVRTQAPSAFEPGAHPGLATEARETIGRALKANLEAIYPQIKETNQTSGEARELAKQIDRFLKREMNKQSTPYFIMPTVGALAGGALGGVHGGAGEGGIGAAAGAAGMHLVRGALEDPAIKARIAILLDKYSRTAAGRIGAKVGQQIAPFTVRVGEYAHRVSSQSPDSSSPD